MDNKLALQSLALDLKRIVQGEISGSDKMIEQFIGEALKWKKQVDSSTLSKQTQALLIEIEQVLIKKNKTRLADDALMYSNLLLHFSK